MYYDFVTDLWRHIHLRVNRQKPRYKFLWDREVAYSKCFVEFC